MQLLAHVTSKQIRPCFTLTSVACAFRFGNQYSRPSWQRAGSRSVAMTVKWGSNMSWDLPKEVLELVKKQPCKLYINGKYVDAKSGATFENACPVNEQSFGKVAKASAEDVDTAVKAAREAFENGPWGKMSARERGRLIYKFADVLEEHADELAMLEAADNGKALSVAKSKDVPYSIEHFRYMAGWADKIQGDTIPAGDGTLCSTIKEPVGVAGGIVPWNYPLFMYTWKVAPALAAGCTVVMKCASDTPLTALKAAELATKAGIPDGVLNVITGSGKEAGMALATHPGVDKIGFTGSTSVGKKIMEGASEHVANISLELGGKSPLIICEDADLETAAQIAHNGLFFNHGQNCCASSRIYVHQKLYDDFVKRSVELAQQITVGNPFDENTVQGPQINSQQFDKYVAYVKSGKEEGARLMCGGERIGDKGFFVQPTVFADVKDDMKISVDEIFGPVMSISPFTDLDDAIKRGNDTVYGLAAGVISNNVNTVNKVARALKAGTVWVNTWNTFDAGAPYGGYKQSGMHRDKGREAIENFLETKAIITPAP